ncbi:hypothetical protein J7T55_004200 [Diaporthe amygdali]|uniref:uncharacterized protein n=1 Tax=Phomopsis amygdali TaxID=1214568 RepID=UPI0022FEC44A|nr:uncharacterized protein J7T55_004200 [Diaporthe amygdali]KAJ0103798.1 hypothetical protein J7T55_004200 [Diaporthe amygdali]
MNTAESLNEICRVLERGDWRSTKTLTIRNAEWPICSRAEWATHPLLHGGKEQWLDVFSSAACDRAFLNLAWQPSSSPRYLALVNRIWLRPSFKRGTRFATKRLLPALNQFPRIISLDIEGNFEAFAPAYNVDHIRQLKIQSVEVDPLRKYDLTDFLSAFKNLESLTIRIDDTSPFTSVPLDCLHLPHLKSFHIDNMTVSETSLFSFLRKHLQGMDFTFMNMNIWDGDWESVVGKLGQLDSIKPFLEEELVECIGPKHFLACVQIISKRARITSEDEAPPARDEAPPVPRQNNVSDSKDGDKELLERWKKYRENNLYDPEDEKKEPLERWKYFNKQLVNSVAGSSKEDIRNRRRKMKEKHVLYENNSDASERTNQHKRIKKDGSGTRKKKVNEDHCQGDPIKKKRKR